MNEGLVGHETYLKKAKRREWAERKRKDIALWLFERKKKKHVELIKMRLFFSMLRMQFLQLKKVEKKKIIDGKKSNERTVPMRVLIIFQDFTEKPKTFYYYMKTIYFLSHCAKKKEDKDSGNMII